MSATRCAYLELHPYSHERRDGSRGTSYPLGKPAGVSTDAITLVAALVAVGEQIERLSEHVRELGRLRGMEEARALVALASIAASLRGEQALTGLQAAGLIEQIMRERRGG